MSPARWAAALVLGALSWFVPGGCIRGDIQEAETAEASATEAEAAASALFEYTPEQAAAFVAELHGMLPVWSDREERQTEATWANYFGPLPAGLVLHTLSPSLEGVPEEGLSGVHHRQLTFSTQLRDVSSDGSGQAPGGLVRSLDWLVNFNNRPDVYLDSMTVSESGVFEASGRVWFRDAPTDVCLDDGVTTDGEPCPETPSP